MLDLTRDSVTKVHMQAGASHGRSTTPCNLCVVRAGALQNTCVVGSGVWVSGRHDCNTAPSVLQLPALGRFTAGHHYHALMGTQVMCQLAAALCPGVFMAGAQSTASCCTIPSSQVPAGSVLGKKMQPGRLCCALLGAKGPPHLKLCQSKAAGQRPSRWSHAQSLACLSKPCRFRPPVSMQGCRPET